MKPNYKRMAGKWKSMYSGSQETISDLKTALHYAQEGNRYKTETIEKKTQEINEWKLKYAELLTENVRLLEKIKALTEVEV